MYNLVVERLNKLVTENQSLNISGWSPKKGKIYPDPKHAGRKIEGDSNKYTCLCNPIDEYFSYFDENTNVLTIHNKSTLYRLSITGNGFLRLCKNGEFIQLFCSEDVLFDGVSLVEIKLNGISILNKNYVLYPGLREYMDIGNYYIMLSENRSQCIITTERTKASIPFQLIAILAPLFYSDEPVLEDIYLSGRYLSINDGKIANTKHEDLAIVAETLGVTWYISNNTVIAEPIEGDYLYASTYKENRLPCYYKQYKHSSTASLDKMLYYSPSKQHEKYIYPHGIEVTLMKPDTLISGDIDSTKLSIRKTAANHEKVTIKHVSQNKEESMVLTATASWAELLNATSLYLNEKGMQK